MNLLHVRSTLVWIVLVSATIVSWAVAADHKTDAGVAVLVVGIAAGKVRLIGLDFMELRHAPWPLRFAFEGYCLALFSLLAGMYLWA